MVTWSRCWAARFVFPPLDDPVDQWRVPAALIDPDRPQSPFSGRLNWSGEHRLHCPLLHCGFAVEQEPVILRQCLGDWVGRVGSSRPVSAHFSCRQSLRKSDPEKASANITKWPTFYSRYFYRVSLPHWFGCDGTNSTNSFMGLYIHTETHKYRRTWNGIQRPTCLNSLDETSQVLEVTWFPLSTSFSTWSNCALRPSYQPPGPILILTKIGQIIPRTGCIDTRWINWGSIHSHHCQLMKHDRSRFCQLLPAARAKLASRRWILAAGPTWKSTCKSTRRQIHCEFHCNKPNEWCGLWFRTFGFDPVI